MSGDIKGTPNFPLAGGGEGVCGNMTPQGKMSAKISLGAQRKILCSNLLKINPTITRDPNCISFKPYSERYDD